MTRQAGNVCVHVCVCVCVCVREKERESECLSEWESGSVVFAPHLFSTPSWLHLSLTEWVRAHTHTHTHRFPCSLRCMVFSCINQQQFWHLAPEWGERAVLTEPRCWFSPSLHQPLPALPGVTLSIRPLWEKKKQHPPSSPFSSLSSDLSLPFPSHCSPPHSLTATDQTFFRTPITPLFLPRLWLIVGASKSEWEW